MPNTKVYIPAPPPPLKEIVQAIAPFGPEKIILYGSQARGDADAHSDIDILIVMPTPDRWDLLPKIRTALSGIAQPTIDLHLLTPDEFHRWRNVPGTLAKPAFHEGKLLYGNYDPADYVGENEAAYGEVADQFRELAEADLEAAKHLLEAGGKRMWRFVCFHAQQCAEHYMKAALVAKGIDFDRTHDLEKLAVFFPQEIRSVFRPEDLKLFEAYAVETHYPGPPPCPNHEFALQSVAAAERIRSEMLRFLPPP